MKLYEYQAKAIFSEFNIPVPRGKVARDGESARQIAQEIGASRWVVKAQIHAGGRGKSGGVRIADTPDEVLRAAEEMLGMTLVTPQTGPRGSRVYSVLVEEAIARPRFLLLLFGLSLKAIRCVHYLFFGS